MKVFTKTIAIMKPAFVFTLLLIQSTLWAQDLETPWRDFISVDARLVAANELERGWLGQQHKLSEEIRNLQQSQSWYNGWIIELLLARKSALQVELADSLQQIRKKIAASEVQRNEAFLALRKVYQQILFAAEPENSLSRSQQEQVLAIGRQLLSQGDVTLELPDYTSILDSPYENDAIKRLVLKDLQSVLLAKLVLIDSLLTAKVAELALLNRLNEFHRDLSYQMKSNLDPATAGNTYEMAAGFNEPVRDSYGDDFISAEGSKGVNWSDESMPDLAPPTVQNPIVSRETSIQLSLNPIDETINRLRNKRQQYQDLLRQIDTELPH